MRPKGLVDRLFLKNTNNSGPSQISQKPWFVCLNRTYLKLSKVRARTNEKNHYGQHAVDIKESRHINIIY